MTEFYHKTDILVVGSGIAGLAFALHAPDWAEVLVATKREKDASSTSWAQGGIASVTSEEDDFESHIEDTLVAGAGLCHRDVVDLVVRDGPNRIGDLLAWGVRFTRKEGPGAKAQAYDLGREGGHSFRRILHSGDFTGEEVERALLAAVATRPNVHLLENHMAVDVITSRKLAPASETPSCHGAYLFDRRTGEISKVASRATVLATGGAGKVYLYTSNPDIATGDGVAIAYRAGARIANLEFLQFHPTCLYHPSARNFLVSEAVRGEGAILRRADSTPLMEGVHPLKDLAPRDIVARAIDADMKRTGAECVYLDITHRDADFLRGRFPNIYARCLSHGFDMATRPIPVVPAAHYLCGGVQTDTDGATSIRGLYAIGETACTGLHGANRLASNSLLEALVVAHRAAGAISQRIRAGEHPRLEVPDWSVGAATESTESVVISQDWDEIRRLMWNYVGIARSEKRLERARRRLELLQEEIADYYWNYLVTADLLELRNIATVADLIVRSASLRKESRGLHYNVDFPDRDDAVWLRDTVL